MGRWAKIGDLKVVKEVNVDDANFLVMVEGLHKRVVKRDDKVGKELINGFRVVGKERLRGGRSMENMKNLEMGQKCLLCSNRWELSVFFL